MEILGDVSIKTADEAYLATARLREIAGDAHTSPSDAGEERSAQRKAWSYMQRPGSLIADELAENGATRRTSLCGRDGGTSAIDFTGKVGFE